MHFVQPATAMFEQFLDMLYLPKSRVCETYVLPGITRSLSEEESYLVHLRVCAPDSSSMNSENEVRNCPQLFSFFMKERKTVSYYCYY